MKLGVVVGYSRSEFNMLMDEILEAERLGFDSIWTSEAYGSDALTPAAWILARTTRIRVGTAIPARTPTSTAMSARNKNFYNNYARQLGYEEAAINIQELFLSGKKPEAVEAVPVELVDDVALVGPPDRIKDNLPRWIEAGKKGHIGSFLASGASIEALRLLAGELL